MGAGSKVKCLFCGDIIQSKSIHDMVGCKCGKLYVDGGSDYLKVSFDYLDKKNANGEKMAGFEILTSNKKKGTKKNEKATAKK